MRSTSNTSAANGDTSNEGLAIRNYTMKCSNQSIWSSWQRFLRTGKICLSKLRNIRAQGMFQPQGSLSAEWMPVSWQRHLSLKWPELVPFCSMICLKWSSPFIHDATMSLNSIKDSICQTVLQLWLDCSKCVLFKRSLQKSNKTLIWVFTTIDLCTGTYVLHSLSVLLHGSQEWTMNTE